MSTEQERALVREAKCLGVSRGVLPNAQYLSLSGGGDKGAFGAGLLVGWTAHGDRPKFKLVTGYPGGNDITLALQRGEVQARCGWSWSSIKITRSDWLADKRINLVLQMALKRSPELPDVPLVTDLARNDRERQILRLMLSRQAMGWPFIAPPDLPADRAQALRKAFDDTMKDPEFLAEAAKSNFEVAPVFGEDMQKIVERIMSTPRELASRAKHLVE
jgi:ABC-type phosphate/phosphonate transport system substrate-binding protein